MTNTPNDIGLDNIAPDGKEDVSPVTSSTNDHTLDIIDTLTPTADKPYNLPARIDDIDIRLIEAEMKVYFGKIIEDVDGKGIDLRNEKIWNKAVENFESLKKFGIVYDRTIPFDINHPLYKLIMCEPFLLNNVLGIASMLDIKNDRHLARVEHAFFKGKNELFFHKELFEECIEYFGLEELQNIFAYDNLPPTRSDNRNLPHPISHKTIYQRMEQGCAIVDFCTHTGFQTGDHISAHFFLDGVKEADIDKGEIHYLGSFAPEIRYFIEKIGISFDKLFAVPAKNIATHCGILRSLQSFAYNRNEKTHVKNFDFRTGRKADEISLEEVFSRDNILHYITMGYSTDKLISLFRFIKEQTLWYETLALDKYIQLKDNTPILEGIKRHHDMQVIIKDSPILNAINWDDILDKKTTIPGFLCNDTLWSTIKASNKINNITGSTTIIDREPYLSDPLKTPPAYLQDQNFLDLLYEYNGLKGALQNNRYQNIDWNIYYNNPSLLPSLIEKIKKSITSPLKNLPIITALSKNLQIGDSVGYPLLNSDPSDNIIVSPDFSNIENNKKLVKKYREMYEAHMGLYSIGGKIHVDRPISDERIKQFLKETGLKQTAFKLIHANTSILLPPSYFAAELMFMIARMSDNGILGESGLFADTERPQLQIAIPGRLPNDLGAILGSSMILLSHQYLEYTKESFSTSHNSDTGRRMVTYDAGVYDSTFIRNSPTITGRTDVLLLRDINLMPKAQIIGSLLGQTKYDGMFADIGEEFIREYNELIDQHGLYNMLQQPWIYDRNTATDEDNLEQHFQAVKSFADRQHMDWFLFNNSKQSQGLLVFKLHKLLQRYGEKIKSRQEHFK